MNIGFFSEMANVEGSAFHMVRQLRWMLANGHTPVMFSSGGSLEPLLEEMGVAHVRIASVKQNAQMTAEQACADGAALARAAAHYNLEAIVTAPSWPFPLAQAAVGDLMPVYLQILSPVYSIPETPQAVEMLRRAANEGRVLANVYEDAVPHAQRFGFPMDRVRLQNLPMDDASARPQRSREEVRAQLGVARDELLILSACRLDADRFPFINPLAQGVQKLRQSGRNVRLMIAGDGSRAADLRAAAPEGTTYLGVRRDMADLYAAADIYCGEGSTVMEAARAGLPVIMTCALTQPQLAGYAYAVFGVQLVDQFWWRSNAVIAPAPFETALALFVDDPQLRRRVGDAGRRMVIEQWSVDEYMRWLLELVAGKNPPSLPVEHAECVIEIEGGAGDDFDRVAQVLAHLPERRIAVEARTAVPWDRYLAIPLEHARAMTRAARRLHDGTIPRYHAQDFTIGAVGERDVDIAQAFASLPNPPSIGTPRIEVGNAPEKTMLIASDGADFEEVIALALRAQAGTTVLCWLRGEVANRESLGREWNARRDPQRGVELLIVEGALPWTFAARLFAAASRYADAGQARFERFRNLASSMGLRIEALPVAQERRIDS